LIYKSTIHGDSYDVQLNYYGAYGVRRLAEFELLGQGHNETGLNTAQYILKVDSNDLTGHYMNLYSYLNNNPHGADGAVCIDGYISSTGDDTGETVTVSQHSHTAEADNLQPYLVTGYIIRTKAEAAVSVIDTLNMSDNNLTDHSTPTPVRGDILAYYKNPAGGISGEYRNFQLFDGLTADGTDEDFVRIDLQNKKVGIGTTTPGATLDVKGDIWVTDPNSTDVAIKMYGENDADTVPDVEFNARALLTAGNSITLGMDKGDDATNRFFSVQKNSNVHQINNENELLYLDESGHLGIGSASGGVRPSSTQQFLVKTDGTTNKHITLTNTSESNGKSSTFTQDVNCLKIETDGNGILIPNNTVIGPSGTCPTSDTECALHVQGDLCVSGSISSGGGGGPYAVIRVTGLNDITGTNIALAYDVIMGGQGQTNPIVITHNGTVGAGSDEYLETTVTHNLLSNGHITSANDYTANVDIVVGGSQTVIGTLNSRGGNSFKINTASQHGSIVQAPRGYDQLYITIWIRS